MIVFLVLLLISIGSGAMVLSFVGFKLFLPLQPAAISAVVFAAMNMIGVVLGLYLQGPLFGSATLDSAQAVTRFFASTLGLGFVTGSAAAWLYLARRTRGKRRA